MLTRFCTALIALISASAAHAEGALVHGTWPNGNPYMAWVAGHTTRQSAIDQALAYCAGAGAFNCSLVQSFNNACVAVAQNTRGAMAYAINPEKHEAHNQALLQCARGHRNCSIIGSACDAISEADLRFEQEEAEAERRVAEEARRQQERTTRPIEDVVRTEQPPYTIPSDVPAASTKFNLQTFWDDLSEEKRNMIVMIAVLSFIAIVGAVVGWTDAPSSTKETEYPAALAITPTVAHPPPLPSQRNPEEARMALELAFHYIGELEPIMPKAFTDPSYKGQVLNTLSLATKQIAIAEENDPSVSITMGEGELTINIVKATALLYEAIARGSDKPHQAVPIIEKAISLAPLAPSAYHWLGDFHVILLNKQAAIAAYEKAVALDPKNIQYRASLDRARNMALSDIAINKAFRAGRTTVNTAKAVFYWTVLGFVLLACGALIVNFGFGNVAFGVLICVGLVLGSKIHQWASR